MTNPTRAELHAQIEELQAKLEAMKPEFRFCIGDEVYIKGRVTDIYDDRTPYRVSFNNGGYEWFAEETPIPAADLIPRAEHERVVGEAVNKALNGDLAAEEKAYALGAINARVRCRNENDALNVLVKDYANESPIRLEKEYDGHTYRVTVERVEGDTPAPSVTAVAPKGVVKELRREATRIRKGQSSSHESHARWLDHIAAQITELPEPSEWAREYIRAKQPHTLIGWMPDKRRDLAAALLESEARDDHA